MNKLKVSKTTKQVFLAIIALILVLYSGHALQSMIGYSSYILMFFAIPAIWFVVYRLDKYRLTSSTVALIIFVLMIALTFITTMWSALPYHLSFCAYIFVAFSISYIFSFKDLVDGVLKIMTVTTVIALIGYFLVNYTEMLLWLPKVQNTNDVEYGVGIIFNYITTIPDRNCGMFWEPGIFATFLVIALVFEITFKREKISIFRIIIFTLGIITSNSSAGFALYFIVLLLFVARNKKTKMGNAVATAVLFILLAVIPVVFFNLKAIIGNTFLADNEYVQKLFLENLEEQSRIKAILHNFQIFSDNSAFGAGWNYVFQNMQSVADTSTSTYLMSVYGFLGTSYTLFWIYGVFRQKKLNILEKIVIIVIIMIIVNKEPHHQNLFTFTLMFFFLKSNSLIEEIDSLKIPSGVDPIEKTAIR